MLHLDYETRSTCDLKTAGLIKYAKDIHTDILLASYAFNDEPVQTWLPDEPVPERITEHVVSGKEVWAHNAPFEIAICNEVGVSKYDWPHLSPAQCVCTMAMSYSMGLPGHLDGTAEALGLDHRKDMSGYRIMLQLSQPRRIEEDGTIVWWDDREKFQKLVAYGNQDVVVEREVGKRLYRLSKEETKVWQADWVINNRGVHLDVKAINAAQKFVEFEKQRLDLDMRVVTAGAVESCTAVAQLTEWLKSKGVETKGVAKGDVTELLKTELPRECRDALLLRQEAAKSSTAKLAAMLEGVCEDGRVRGLFQYHGAGTGRWAGRRVQFQNLPRPTISQAQIEEVFAIIGEIQ